MLEKRKGREPELPICGDDPKRDSITDREGSQDLWDCQPQARLERKRTSPFQDLSFQVMEDGRAQHGGRCKSPRAGIQTAETYPGGLQLLSPGRAL
jgi:hypothetical protein